MSTFELQTFHAGKWAVDSYFDDRDLAMSEAERLDNSPRHSGVRVLQEDFDDGSDRSTVRVIFTKVKDGGETDGGWRGQVKKPSQKPSQKASGTRAASNGGTKSKRQPKKQHGTSNLYWIISIAVILLLAGVAAMIGLQEFAKIL